MVIGISADSIERQKKFEEKEKLKVALLSDPEHRVLEKYGMWGEKKLYGKVSVGIIRSTVVIDKKGRVVKVFRSVKTKEHAAKVLEFMQQLES